MRLYDLKVNHLRNPLGFRMERTVFSWKVAESLGKTQESARLLVALDEKLENVVFDSGLTGRRTLWAIGQISACAPEPGTTGR